MTTTLQDRDAAFATIDTLVRDRLPSVLDTAGMHPQALTLRNLPPIVDDSSVRTARAAGCEAFQEIYAARLDPTPAEVDAVLIAVNEISHVNVTLAAANISGDAVKLAHDASVSERIATRTSVIRRLRGLA